ncbi:outer membrane protein with beta-barrel domain [Larkinella arboricola]|uniref:Outer membrane protein with beta-barrel domain n=1 Tax=Larkinella arboricola TaxID=643671 RepID=A0A327X7X0_LARAB|nr:porin family protein [Larkinella arboricola]RAK02769.1 outer membrane protein with beta-barrel domain [Larkinella arboricola]
MLKVRLLLLLAFSFASFSSFAQLQGVFGLKAGASSSITAQEGVTPYISRYKTAFHLGGIYRLRYQRFVAQPELLLSVKGGSFKRTAPTQQVIRNNYNYISLPVLLGWIPTEGLVLQAGPEFSYALNTPNGPGKKQDTGIAVGAHYDFLDMAEKFSLHLRYIYGLNNVSANPIVEHRNRTFQVSIVYNFYKKGK